MPAPAGADSFKRLLGSPRYGLNCRQASMPVVEDTHLTADPFPDLELPALMLVDWAH